MRFRYMNNDIDGQKRVVCPKCGGKIMVSELYQSTRDRYVKPDGQLSKKYTIGGTWMPMEVSIAYCENTLNSTCDNTWDADEFDIKDNEFIDYKEYEELTNGND